MARITVSPADNKLSAFVEFPYKLHAQEKCWVPEFKADVKDLLSPSHPFRKTGSINLFLAERDGKTVGRIAAIVNNSHNAIHNEKCGFFGFFECENDAETAKALISGAKEFLKARGMDIFRGPVNPSTNYSCGLLIEGNDLPPMMMMPWNPPYYAQLMQDCGLEKAKDLLAFIRKTDGNMSDRLLKILARIERKGFKIRPFDINQLDREITIMREIYNDAWSENWGFVPLTAEEVEHDAKNLKLILKPGHGSVIDVEGEPAGVCLALPDVNLAMAKTKGSLNPLNIIPFLWTLKHLTQSRLITLGVKKKFRNLGLDLLLVRNVIESAKIYNWTHGELGWILEDNAKIISVIEEAGGTPYKRLRIYQSAL
jgi:hypothetical protein